MSAILNIEIEVDEAKHHLSSIADNLDNIIDEVIFTFIKDLKEYALHQRRWNNRTGALEAGHFIEPLEDGWRLRVDASETSGKSFNYAWALERGHLSYFAWIRPALDTLEAELPGRLDTAIQNALKMGKDRFI